MKRREFLHTGALALGAHLAGCASRPPAQKHPPLLLLSLDAFRWDYCAMHPDETPNLRELMRTGVAAKGLIPVFPSNTFPNHYTIVTGLYPARHGIVNNTMFDEATGEFFRYNQFASASQSRWWGGEPIWVTAAKQGGAGGSSFWPGTEAEIGGVRPALWRRYDGTLSFESRLDELVAWLARTQGTKPVVAVMYLEETNSVGHRFGVGSPELAAAIKVADDRVGRLRARLRSAGVDANMVIVSDHGMTPISETRVILLDEYLDAADVQLDFDGPVAGLRPLRGEVADLVRALGRVRHAKVYRREELPARFQLRDNPRISPVWLVPEEGWEIHFRPRFESFRGRFNKGDHGYDPAFASMHGILIAQGPSFRRGVELPAVENIHVYNLLCAALGLTPAPNDGDDRLLRPALRG